MGLLVTASQKVYNHFEIRGLAKFLWPSTTQQRKYVCEYHATFPDVWFFAKSLYKKKYYNLFLNTFKCQDDYHFFIQTLCKKPDVWKSYLQMYFIIFRKGPLLASIGYTLNILDIVGLQGAQVDNLILIEAFFEFLCLN